MFGMTEKEFWEDDPQLYWSYRIFYYKKLEDEAEQKSEFLKHEAWLKGNINFVATSIALSNGFSKKKSEYPTFDEFFNKGNKNKNNTKSKKEINREVQDLFNSWARF